MTLAAKAGTFDRSVSTVTGLGFRPVSIIFWTENATADNVWSPGLDVGYGFWCRPRPTLAIRQQSAWVSSNDNSGSANAAAGVSPKTSISNRSWTMTITERADNDGFDISWSNTPTGTRVHYLALNVDALSQIMATTLATTLLVGQIVQIRAVGFQPSAVLAISQLLSSGNSKTLGFGAADSSGNQWAMSGSSLHNAAVMDTDRAWSESNIINLVDSTGAVVCAAKIVGIVADGFDLQIITKPISTTTVYFLCLGNVLAKAGAAAKPTGVAPAAQSLNAGFAAKGFLLGGTHQTAVGATAHHRGFMGAVSSGVNAAGAWADTNAADPSNTNGISRSTVAAIKADNEPPSIEAAATGTLTSTGMDLSWSPNDGVASRFGFFAVGNLAHSLGGDIAVATQVLTNKFWQPQRILGSASNVLTRAETLTLWQVAILGGDAIVATESLANLRVRSRLGGSSNVNVEVLSSLRLKHTLGGASDVPTLAETLYFWQPVPLRGDVLVATAIDSSIALKHKVGGDSLIATLAEAYFTFLIPYVRPATSDELPGTVNWHINPGAEDGLQGWKAKGAGTLVSEEFVTVWEGGRAVAVDTPGSAAGEGFITESIVGTDLTGVEMMMFLSVYASGNNIPVETWARAHYFDGTQEDGEHQTGIVLTSAPNWQRLKTPPISLNPAKKLRYLEQHVATEVATDALWFADGAQIEEARGADPTPWTSGNYGLETGYWEGAPNRSVSIREPLLMQTKSVGYGGEIEVEVQLFRMTWDNQVVEDITDTVIQGNVVADPKREVTWTFDATLTREGWERLEENYDWIAPFATVTYPDGRVRHGQLGLYFVVPSISTFDEHLGTVKLSAFDPLWLIARQGMIGNLVVQPGPDKAAAIRAVLNGAALTGGVDERPGGLRRFDIPNHGKQWKKRQEWSKEDNRLKIANEIAEACGFYPLWTDGRGFIQTRPMNTAKMKDRTPVRSWTANVPKDFVSAVEIRKLARVGNEVFGKIPTTPKGQDLFDEIILVNDDPDTGKIFVKGKIKRRGGDTYVITKSDSGRDDDRDRERRGEDDERDRRRRRRRRDRREGRGGRNPRTTDHEHNRHRGKKLTIPYLDDQATAEEMAAALVDQLSVSTEYITLATIIDPEPDFIYETVTTAIFNLDEDPIAVGHWAVNRVSYALWPSTPIMTLELSRIRHGADDIDIEIEVASA